MRLTRLILAPWALNTQEIKPKVLEGVFSDTQIVKYNRQGYNVYYLPNPPSTYEPGITVDGSHITEFSQVFVDYDTKSGTLTKDQFIETISIPPTSVVDSGNGVHVYWQVKHLDAMSYLRFQRRLLRLFNTDPAVGQIFQLMRLPGTDNVKIKGNRLPCVTLAEQDISYTAEEFDKLLPAISLDDETYCKQHYDRTYNRNSETLTIDDEIPPKFGKLLRASTEAKEIWQGETDDRSKNDYRLGHLMLANDFTRDEAMSVLVNSAKALQRAPVHRQSYAENIVNKIWTYEEAEDKEAVSLSSSVKDILKRSGDKLTGTRFPCWKWVDNTECGFRLGHVMGLVAGSGVGKTAMALNLFQGFVKFNPDYDHFFCPLEQVDREIAQRWQTMCGENTALHDKVHILSNYDENGTFRDLSLAQIKEHILEFKRTTGKNVGCVVIDHIGVLCNTNRLGQDEGVKQIAKDMKGFAVETNTFLIMQSQTSRALAGIGDIELDKGSAFGTSVFENFCDWLVTLWQPLKRLHAQESVPTVTAFKFAKIRHKKAKKDKIKEDVCYWMYFDSETELMRELTQDEKTSFKYWLPQAVNKRKNDRKTELIEYVSTPKEGVDDGTDSNRQHLRH